jgi:hypothetical protein
MPVAGGTGMAEPFDKLREQKAQTQELLGRIVMLWGDIMGLVYSLPEVLEFSSPDAIKLCLAELNGDGTRIDHLAKLLKHKPKFAGVGEERIATTLRVLAKLKGLAIKRDAFIHGVPTMTMQRDIHTKELVLDGCYLIQTRKLDEKARYMKVPEAAEEFLNDLTSAYDELLRIARPMLFEDWHRLWLTAP